MLSLAVIGIAGCAGDFQVRRVGPAPLPADATNSGPAVAPLSAQQCRDIFGHDAGTPAKRSARDGSTESLLTLYGDALLRASGHTLRVPMESGQILTLTLRRGTGQGGADPSDYVALVPADHFVVDRVDHCSRTWSAWCSSPRRTAAAWPAVCWATSAASCCTCPSAVQTQMQEVMGSNRQAVADGHGIKPGSSLDSLTPGSPLVEAINDTPIRPGVHLHSIIGDRGRPGQLDNSSDGVVPYTSSHLPQAESERIVPAGHTSTLRRPETSMEILRVLHR